LKTINELRAIYNMVQPDIIHTHHDYLDIPATIAAPKKSKVVWHYHNSTIFLKDDLKSKLKNFIHYSLVGRRARLISVSEFYRKLVVEKGGFPANKSTTIINGIDIDRLQSINKTVGNKPVFLAFGYKPEIKGVDILLEACERLELLGVKFELWLVFSEKLGENWVYNKYDGELPSWLVLKEPTEKIEDYYSHASIFISASRNETFSYSVAESIFCSIPVVSSDIPGLDWAKEVPSVFFFQTENVAELTTQIIEILNHDQDELVKKTLVSRELIKKKYSLDIWIDAICSYYDQLHQ